jgi:cyclic pyranopterin phosphate synthase
MIARLNELRGLGLKSIAMTTNGIALHRRLPEFIDNGLSHLNLRYFFHMHLTHSLTKSYP